MRGQMIVFITIPITRVLKINEVIDKKYHRKISGFDIYLTDEKNRRKNK